MDDAWKAVYDSRARRDLPEYKKSCWTKEGFEELLMLTLKFVDETNSEDKIESVLDVGSGTGIYCNELNLKGYNVTGIDYSEEMIKFAKKTYPNIPFEVGNGYNLRFVDRSFDMILSIGALQCLMEHEKFLREISRVAKKHLIISTLYREEDGKDPKEILKKQLMEDSWPTREYAPSEIIPILESEGFTCKIIRENNGKEIIDGYFIIGKRN